jgi:hypothetical protein
MTTYLYPCHVFQQRSGGDELIIFAAPAGEIKEWAGVPRKHFDYQHGFQRTLAEGRVEDLAEFYAESEKNFSPTSVVIALKSDQYSLMELDESPSEAFRQLQLDVIEYENESTDVLIEQCIQILHDRLGDDITDQIDSDVASAVGFYPGIADTSERAIMLAGRMCHVEEKEVQQRVQTGGGSIRRVLR